MFYNNLNNKFFLNVQSTSSTTRSGSRAEARLSCRVSNVDKLKQCLVEVWIICSVINSDVSHWQLRACVHAQRYFEHLLWACLTHTWIERTYVQIKYWSTLFIYKTIRCFWLNLSCLCSVIFQGKTVALDRWVGIWNHLSMTHSLITGYAKNYCNQTLIVQVIVENVVTFFFRDTLYVISTVKFRSHTYAYVLHICKVWNDSTLKYTVGHKKRAPKLLSITLAVINRFR